MKTDVSSFISDLDAGVFEEKLGRALSDVAGSVIDHGKEGRVTVSFDFKQISASHQVTIAHKLTYSRPTLRGKRAEEDVTETPMYVGSGGALTYFPEGQGQMFDIKGKINKEEMK